MLIPVRTPKRRTRRHTEESQTGLVRSDQSTSGLNPTLGARV